MIGPLNQLQKVRYSDVSGNQMFGIKMFTVVPKTSENQMFVVWLSDGDHDLNTRQNSPDFRSQYK
jgi:hypothetical protein